MQNSKIKPEYCYPYQPLTKEDISKAFLEGDSLTGYVMAIHEDKEELVVRLGDSSVALMPFSEATIYPLIPSKRPESSVPANIMSLLNKKVRVKVDSISDDNISVSRRANMNSTYKLLQNCGTCSFRVLNMTTTTAFGDVGDGIIGILFIKDVCRAHIQDISEYFRRGDIYKAAIIHRDSKKRFELSTKKISKPYIKSDFNIGMVVRGKVCNRVPNSKRPGYYINISPQVSGIMNINNHEQSFEYGTSVECLVTGIGDKGLHLEFFKMA